MNYTWRAFKSTNKKDMEDGLFLPVMGKPPEPKHNDFLVVPYIVPGLLSAQECNKLLKLRDKIIEEEAKVDQDGQNKNTVRVSSVQWLFPNPDTNWIFDRIERAITMANECYKFDLFGFFQGAQIGTYRVGGHYDWHTDLGNGNASTRKLSLTLQLSDPTDYEGGNLEFRKMAGQLQKDQGTAVIFPSYLLHRVAPVNSGTRVSLVSWISGPAIR